MPFEFLALFKAEVEALMKVSGISYYLSFN